MQNVKWSGFRAVSFALLALLLAGCGPSDPALNKIAESKQALLLTDAAGRQYSATWAADDRWELRPIEQPKKPMGAERN